MNPICEKCGNMKIDLSPILPECKKCASKMSITKIYDNHNADIGMTICYKCYNCKIDYCETSKEEFERINNYYPLSQD